MPYEWTRTAENRRLRLWAHQSMTPQGFVWFIGSTAVLLTLPIFAVLGSIVAWVLLAFFLAALTGVWSAIKANQKARQVHEELTLSDTSVHLEHIPAKGAAKSWDANPEWVSVHIHPKGPVDDYLTLRGGGREVELGAFLTPEERKTLHGELSSMFRGV